MKKKNSKKFVTPTYIVTCPNCGSTECRCVQLLNKEDSSTYMEYFCMHCDHKFSDNVIFTKTDSDTNTDVHEVKDLGEDKLFTFLKSF